MSLSLSLNPPGPLSLAQPPRPLSLSRSPFAQREKLVTSSVTNYRHTTNDWLPSLIFLACENSTYFARLLLTCPLFPPSKFVEYIKMKTKANRRQNLQTQVPYRRKTCYYFEIRINFSGTPTIFFFAPFISVLKWWSRCSARAEARQQTKRCVLSLLRASTQKYKLLMTFIE